MTPLPGLTQRTPLTLDLVFERLRTVHADGRVVDAEGETTYGALAERILRLARVLTDELGVRPGDRVATFAFNSTRHLELYFAVPLIGAVLHTVNVRLHPDQVAFILDHAGDEVAFVDGALLADFARIAGRERLRHVVRMGKGPDGAVAGQLDHDELVAAADPLRDLPRLDEDAALGLCYTSGTTGDPKGVLTSHRGMLLHTMAACMADHIGLRESDVVLPVVPMFHAFAWGLPYAAPFVGAELAFHGADSSPEHLGTVLSTAEVTVAAGVPTIWKSLLPGLRSGKLDAAALRLVFVGGAASPRALIEAYDDLGIEYLQVWGMTETGPLACASRPRRRHRGLTRDQSLDVRERTGTIFAGLRARITDEAGRPLPQDGQAVGELEVTGPWIASGYYRLEADDRFNDGWLRTGDMATMEPDGYLRIVDRAKDLVKSGGEWISSVELEGHLLAHPDVADAAVVGMPSRRWDERPVAVVVPVDPDAPPTLAQLHAFLVDRVAKWWLPDAVTYLTEIPKTSVGKLDKRTLRASLDLELD
ncbi:long-chain-fatty-acid--CoA ligase [Egicoccus sp. AB-alg6-2]|uniref:long-chain-fatty-acid--CoA ligase n=1 Tax=Egicoccus sp. AB-alg6-2 TaxID=3242692 RepID=UPI00359CE125